MIRTTRGQRIQGAQQQRQGQSGDKRHEQISGQWQGFQSLAECVAHLEPDEIDAVFEGLSDTDCQSLLYDWKFWARDNQLAPMGAWHCWLVLAGRGFGKTRMGVEWVRMNIMGDSPLMASKGAVTRIALVGHTHNDVRDVMVEGESGILAQSPPDFRPKFEPSLRRLTWPNGVVATLYSAEEPDQLRGPQHHLAWADEVAKWRYGTETWSNLMMGLRLGDDPRVMATTTPRKTALIRQLINDPHCVVTRGSTFDNRANLSSTFLAHMEHLYVGTRLGRQEIYGEFLDDTPGALWQRDHLDQTRVAIAPDLIRIVVAVDPPVTHGPKADACGIIVMGMAETGHLYLLADLSTQGQSPQGWAKGVIKAYHAYGADRVVAEVNNGGDLVESLLRQNDPLISYRAVRATRGKMARAEPVAALYERGLVHHVGGFDKLEDELCSYVGDPRQNSPDRMDALVWAAVDLLSLKGFSPRIRSMA